MTEKIYEGIMLYFGDFKISGSLECEHHWVIERFRNMLIMHDYLFDVAISRDKFKEMVMTSTFSEFEKYFCSLDQDIFDVCSLSVGNNTATKRIIKVKMPNKIYSDKTERIKDTKVWVETY